MGDDDGVRSAAYGSLVEALLGVRADPATARFDAELAAAEAAGTLDPGVARTLRWWQRQSVQGVADHLAGVLPGVLTSLAAAERAAAEMVAASADSWAAATEPPSDRRLPPPDPGPTGPATSEDPPGFGPPGPRPRPPADPGGAPHLRPVDTGPVAPAPATAPPLRPGFVPAPAGPPAAPPVPPSAVRPAGPVAHDSGQRGAPPRRLLVAGLTVLPDDGVASRSAHPHRSPYDRSSTMHDDVPGASG
jgi:hypothetical protein